ncbi:hypothetical protein FOL47_006620 [Perkinsus chesapeaki]|uniref:Uncharacterized protein n=1 Tax=Perkinsus chesapeaki TaxID=330153 RepID=A0A7J6LQL3_PERCH|nr:hypothetical protein FOL47_006620 [Perkinsus chesapeaki]
MRFFTSLLYYLDISLVLATKGMLEDGYKPLPLLMGESDEGARYYVLLTPANTKGKTWSGDQYYSEEGYECRPFVFLDKPSRKASAATVSAYVVDKENGSQFFAGEPSITQDTCVRELKRYDPTVEPQHSTLLLTGTFSLDDPSVKSLNNMYKNEELLYKVTGEEQPAANALYYGFVKNNLEVKVSTDAKRKIKTVEVEDSTGVGYGRFQFLMLGKAMLVRLRNAQQRRTLVLEPVDKDKFAGKATFVDARLDSFEGEPFSKDRLPALLNLKKPKNKPSLAARVREFSLSSRPQTAPLQNDGAKGAGEAETDSFSEIP